MPQLLGRTNTAFPDVWLSLVWDGHSSADGLVQAAIAADCPIEVSSAPALWGGYGAGKAKTVLATGGREMEGVSDPGQAYDLIGARLIEVLSGLGRRCLDIFAFQYRTALEESVLDQVFAALESARSEGLVRFVALEPVGPVLASRAMWQFRDAFELLILSEDQTYDSLISLADQRRVGVVRRGKDGAPCLSRVHSSEEVNQALGVPR